MDKITVFVGRLKRIGIDVELNSNYPWIYITKINGKKIIETFQANHGFTVAFSSPLIDGESAFTDITEIFKLIRKYK